MQYDFLVKCVVVGETGVGKSALVRYVNEKNADNFNPQHIATIGVDFTLSWVRVRDKVCKLQIWDTSGEERFRNITTAYYRGCQVALLVYDVTNRRSFVALNKHCLLYTSDAADE